MSCASVSLVCWFNGILTIDMYNNPRYINGVGKPMIVRKSITWHELVEKIYRITKINPKEYQIQLTCNCPIRQGHFTTVSISDNDDTRTILELHHGMNLIEIYVEKDSVSHRMHGEYTFMLDLVNESTVGREEI